MGVNDNNNQTIQNRCIRKEQTALNRILRKAGIPEGRRKALLPVIANVAFMKYRLDAAREELISEPLTETYTNGENQGGVKVSSKFKAYEDLWKSYMQGMTVILNALPQKAKEETPTASRPQTVLELVQSRRRKEA